MSSKSSQKLRPRPHKLTFEERLRRFDQALVRIRAGKIRRTVVKQLEDPHHRAVFTIDPDDQ